MDRLAGIAEEVARAFGLSLANQWLPVFAVVALAGPLDADVALHWYAVIIPFTTLASLLPISIGGTGVREALFVALFGAVGMRPEVALVLSLSTLAVALAWGLVGLALFAVGRAVITELGLSDDPRVECLANPSNLGMVANWNACLDAARTPLVTLLHADDALEPAYARTMRARCWR